MSLILHHFRDTAKYWSKSANLNLPHLYLSLPLGWPCWNVAKIFGIRKLEFLGYHTALFAWSYS